MIYNIKTIENDEKFLRQISKDVLKDDVQIKNDIKVLSLYCKENKVFAMASIQLGIPKKIIYVKAMTEDEMYSNSSNERMVLINPEIIEEKGETYYWEYCMSCLDNMGKVKRPYYIKIKYLDENFNEKETIFEGISATIVSHEYDHLYGILHIDIADKLCQVKFDERKSFREKKGNGYKIVSKTGEYKHPLR